MHRRSGRDSRFGCLTLLQRRGPHSPAWVGETCKFVGLKPQSRPIEFAMISDGETLTPLCKTRPCCTAAKFLIMKKRFSPYGFQLASY